jgi:hypothetical protein
MCFEAKNDSHTPQFEKGKLSSEVNFFGDTHRK